MNMFASPLVMRFCLPTSLVCQLDEHCFCPAAIPFIVHPIDNLIHALMNMTLRPNMRTFVCGPGQGCLADLEMCKDCKVAEAPASTSNGTKP